MHDIGPLIEFVGDGLNGVTTWRRFFIWLGIAAVVIGLAIIFW